MLRVPDSRTPDGRQARLAPGSMGLVERPGGGWPRGQEASSPGTAGRQGTRREGVPGDAPDGRGGAGGAPCEFRVDRSGSLVVRPVRFDRRLAETFGRLPRHLRRWDVDRRAWVLRADPRSAVAVWEAAARAGIPLPAHAERWIDGCRGMPEVLPVEVAPGDGCVLVRTSGREVSDAMGMDWVPGASWDRRAWAWKVPLGRVPLEHLMDRLRLFGVGVPDWLRKAAEEARARESEMSERSRATAALESGIQERLRAVLPEGLSLYPYQVAAVEFAERAGGRVLIADQMGLGKTPTTIAWLLLHPEARPAVVFCPAMVRLQWLRELRRWAPGESCEVVLPSADVRRLARRGLPAVRAPSGRARVVVVNYESAARHAERLAALGPATVVLDEAHWIKERSAQRTRAVLSVARRARHVIALSGTPLLNRPIEFYNVLDLLRPGRFGSWWKFAERYCGLHHNGYGWVASGATNVGELADVLRGEGIMIRRLKADILHDLPAKERRTVYVELDPGRSAELDREVDTVRSVLLSPEAAAWLRGESRPPGPAAAAIARLRAALGAAKTMAVIPWLAELSADRQVVAFFHHVACARAAVEALWRAAVAARAVTGEEGPVARQSSVDAFQRGDVQVLCATYGAAGVGLNLQAASEVVKVEREWVPAVEEQAEDRVHRVGQQAQVTVWEVVSDHPVDTLMGSVLARKTRIVGQIVDGQGPGQDTGEAAVLEFARKLVQGLGW